MNVFWFKEILIDNTALSKALLTKSPTLPIFIFDSNITDELPVDDARISFIYQQLEKFKHSIKMALGY